MWVLLAIGLGAAVATLIWGRKKSPRVSVGAALSLFASIGMMFWYVLRLTTRLQRG